MHRPGLYLALQTVLQEVQHLFIVVELIGAHIGHHGAYVGHHIVLCARLNHGHIHHRATQKLADTLKTVLPQEVDVVVGDVERVHPLTAGRMARLPVGGEVEHHQPSLRHRRLHAGGLSHNGQLHRGQGGQYGAYAVGTRHLFLGRGQEEQVVRLRPLSQHGESLPERHQSAPAVIAPQTVQPVALKSALIGVAAP